MGISKEQFIEATGGFRLGDPMTLSPLHGKTIQKLEDKLKSGNLSFDQIEEVLTQLRTLKGIPSPEWDYDDPNK